MSSDNATPHPSKTWPDGWTARQLVDLINNQLEASGSPIRFRLLPDDEPRANHNPPGVHLTDVLQNRTGRNPGNLQENE
jgi:hypothetical protein